MRGIELYSGTLLTKLLDLEKRGNRHCGKMSTKCSKGQCMIDIPSGMEGIGVKRNHNIDFKSRSRDIKSPLLSGHPHRQCQGMIHIKSN